MMIVVVLASEKGRRRRWWWWSPGGREGGGVCGFYFDIARGKKESPAEKNTGSDKTPTDRARKINVGGKHLHSFRRHFFCGTDAVALCLTHCTGCSTFVSPFPLERRYLLFYLKRKGTKITDISPRPLPVKTAWAHAAEDRRRLFKFNSPLLLSPLSSL